MSVMDMTQLVSRAQAGERAAFDELARRFEAKIYQTVFARLRNASDAREVTQEVFLQAYRKLPQLREPRLFAAWLRRIAERMAITRAVRGGPIASVTSRLHETCDARDADPLDRLLQRERVLSVRAALGQLRAMDRETLVAFYLNGRSLQEMCADFESPEGTIKRRLHVARNRLREVLEELQPA